MKTTLRNCLTLAVLSAAIVPANAGTFQLQLDPGPGLTAPPGGTIMWNLMIENDDPALFLSIDTVNWTAVLDPAQGLPDNFNSFLFPLVGPTASESDPFFSIQWLSGATPGYSAGNSFVIGTSLCVDSNYNGCVPNDDVTLPFVASVSQSDTAAPEPGTVWLLGAALLAVGRLRLRTWRGHSWLPRRDSSRRFFGPAPKCR